MLALREAADAKLPLLLMNSFSTREESLEALEHYPELDVGLPLDFVQSKEPKLLVDELTPVEWPDNPALEWCPPGHGDLYPSLVTSGMLDDLLERGFEYAFMANSDNLGAMLEPRILAWMRGGADPVPDGGRRAHGGRPQGRAPRAPRQDGRLVLRETAQTPDEDLARSRTSRRTGTPTRTTCGSTCVRSTSAMRERDGVLGLPMIRNQKTVDPADKSSPAVFQLETAMGAAIEVFEGARRSRSRARGSRPSRPPTTCSALRSDAYVLTDDARVELVPRARSRSSRSTPTTTSCSHDFEARFPEGAPSLARRSGSRSKATCASARASWSAARCPSPRGRRQR